MIKTAQLRKAADQLAASLDYARSDLAKDPGLFEQFRNSSIQCFEYTYELAITTLRKALSLFESGATVRHMTFKELISLAGDVKLIENPTQWFSYRDARNASSHTYREELAERIFEILPLFLKDVRELCERVEEAQR